MKNNELPWGISVIVVPIVQLLLALLVSSFIVLLVGENPLDALKYLVRGSVGSPEALSYTLYYTTNLIFTGLAVAVAAHAGLFNIGGEGQVYLGGLGVALIMLAFDSVLPFWAILPLVIVGGALMGAFWAWIPGYLEAKRGAHVVVTTIMLNYIASALMNYLIIKYLMPGGMYLDGTRPFADSAVMPKFYEIFSALPNSLFNPSILLALAAAYAVWFLLWRTRLGYAIRTVGQNPGAARYAGIPHKRIIIITMMISGALAGMMAVNEVYGAQGRLTQNFTNGYGFIGIAVALMGRNHPVGVLFAAFLFGALFQGGSELQFDMDNLSKEMVLVIQGLVVFFTAALDQLLRRPLERWYSGRVIRSNQGLENTQEASKC
ncbi:MAG: sugar ABC transporter permease [Gammaproteobacteria bacterium]|nr:MAG: sugar ABC transporter permease [Gammaproteobacteria bacterium]